MASKQLLPLFLLLSVATSIALAQYEYAYDYSYGYGDFYDAEQDFGDFYDDAYGYYGNDDLEYYEYYGYYSNGNAYVDYYPDDGAYVDYYEECFFDADGKAVLANGTASCDIRIKGVDKQADKLKGGLDGVYALSSCYNGKPKYTRKGSPPDEERVLWYSSTFGDWDVSRGTEPNEAEIIMYGGEMEHASVPLFVGSWHLGGDLKTSPTVGEDEYLPISLKVSCADGTEYTEGSVKKYSPRTGPLLSDEELENKYRVIIGKVAADNLPSPTVNFTFVVLLVMTGLTIVLAIPYFLLKKKTQKGSISSSFATMLQQSKKKQSGHIN